MLTEDKVTKYNPQCQRRSDAPTSTPLHQRCATCASPQNNSHNSLGHKRSLVEKNGNVNHFRHQNKRYALPVDSLFSPI